MNLNISQLEYLVAIDNYKSFSEAARQCHVTQPTLSMQIKKLEDFCGRSLLDRSKQPLAATEVGRDVIQQARVVLSEIRQIKEIVKYHDNVVEGELYLGIIPTVAPYLVPLFMGDFLRKFPSVRMHITEAKTEDIIEDLKNETLDAGILATPLEDPLIRESPIYYEKLLCYLHSTLNHADKHKIGIEDILNDKVWVLSEGNCFRNQTFNLCAINQIEFKELSFDYESGSIEALMRLVDREGGSTIIPELASLDLEDEKLDRVKFIGPDNPVREISLAVRRKTLKKKLLDLLIEEIKINLPRQILENQPENVISVY